MPSHPIFDPRQSYYEETVNAFVGPLEDTSGRGGPMVKKCNRTRNYRFHAGNAVDPMGPGWLSHLLTQSNRCTHLANCIAARARGHTSGSKLSGLQDDIENTTAGILKFLHHECSHGHTFHAMLDSADAATAFLDPSVLIDLLSQASFGNQQVMALKAAASKYLKLHDLNSRAIRRAKAARLNKPRTVGGMCRHIKGDKASPLLCVRATLPDGTKVVRTKPSEVDEVVINTWSSVFQGNLGPASTQSAYDLFMSRYAQHFKFQQAFELQDITGDRVLQGIQIMLDNSPGLDGVLAGDLKAISPRAAE